MTSHRPVSPREWLRVLRMPPVRIVVFVAMFGALVLAMRWVLPWSGVNPFPTMAATGWPLLAGAVRLLVPVLVAYGLLVRVIEGRQLSELALRHMARRSIAGWVVGMVIMLTVAATLALTGAYRIEGVNKDIDWFGRLLALALLPAIAEEVLFRGVLFRVIEDGLGTWIALVSSAVFFGGAHAHNPNATLWSSVAIAIEAGLLLGMAYAWSRSLWFCMGLHAAWNFTQATVLGIAVAGVGAKGWMLGRTQGPTWLSGGEFGAEASIVAVVICLAVAGVFTRQAIATRNIRLPYWRR